jgi:hypothetical protein
VGHCFRKVGPVRGVDVVRSLSPEMVGHSMCPVLLTLGSLRTSDTSLKPDPAQKQYVATKGVD